uniref:Uncharacterized protein n=1 Tax=Schistosoma mansoni TaxID=6183 RepID=A0A5K4FB71_SCHMA
MMTLLLIQSCHGGSSGTTPENGNNTTNGPSFWSRALGSSGIFCTLVEIANVINNFFYGKG